jgi:hypothetical protein
MSQLCLDTVTVPRLPKNLIVKRLTWDWNDPSEVVRQEILALKGIGSDACSYLNPMFKVLSSEPAREFFLEARRCQREWCRVLTRQFGSANWKRKMWVTKDVMERRMTFSGVMFIDHELVDPRRQFLLEAEAGLHPESDVVLALRPDAGAYLKERDWQSLAELSRLELRNQLASSPLDPVYVLPGITVMGFRPNSAFYAEVSRRSREWHRRLCRLLDNSGYRRLERQSDWQTKMLVLHGALAVDGAIYLPGHWPNQPPRLTKLKKTPFGKTTVPLDFLGVNVGL